MTAVSSGINAVVPTFREAPNIPLLIAWLDALRTAYNLNFRLTVDDDHSQDGTEETTNSLNPWPSPIVRTGERGFSSAVLEGLKHTGDVVAMDADLSHPPEAISQMLSELVSECDFVVGSRCGEGGSTPHDWGLFRGLNSRVATILASPFIRIEDPISSFVALRRTYADAVGSIIGTRAAGEEPVTSGCPS